MFHYHLREQRKMTSKASFIAILVFAALSAAAFSSDFLFEHLTSAQGLSSNKVSAILQDRSGYLWIGTRNGLNLYDGYEFIHYHYTNSDSSILADNRVLDIIEDNDGSLWIATGHGLTHLSCDAKSASHFYAQPADPKSLSNDYIICLYRDSRNQIWIGTAWGLNRYNRSDGTFERYMFDAPQNKNVDRDRIWAIAEAPDNSLWVGTDDGIFILDIEQHTLWNKNPQHELPEVISTAPIRTIIFDENSNAWIGADNGLFSFNLKTKELSHFTSSPTDKNSLSLDHILSLSFDSKSDLWIGTERGLNRLLKNSNKFEKIFADLKTSNSLSDNFIDVLYIDQSQNLWIGTEGGLNKFSPEKQQFHAATIDISEQVDNNIQSLVQVDKDKIWLSSHSGLYEWDLKKNTFQSLYSVFASEYSERGSYIKALYKQDEDNLWLGTNSGNYGGIYNYSFQDHQIVDTFTTALDSLGLNGRKISCFGQGDKNEIWIGSEGAGIHRLNPETGRLARLASDYESPDVLAGNWIFSIFKDSDGFVWVGTENGLSRFDPHSEKFKTFRHRAGDKSSICADEVLAIFQDQEGAIWIGTENGLNRYAGDDMFESYRPNNDLNNESIHAIVQDGNGFLWLSTPFGISRFDPQTAQFRNYDADDGIQVRDFNFGASLLLQNGKIIFAGHNGLVWFNPDQIKETSIIPATAITRISDYNKPIFQGKELINVDKISLPYSENFIEIEFAVLEYTSPSQNRFSYMLEGYDRGWRQLTQQRKATYSNLPPGRYTFRVKGATALSKWNEKGARIAIEIIPPFWQKSWFQMISFLLLVGIFVTFAYARYRRAKKRRLYLEKIVAERTRELEMKNIDLLRAKDDYQNLYDYAPIGFQEINRESIIIQTNDTAARILGFAKDEMIGRPVFDFIAAEEQEEAKKTFSVLMTGEPSEGALERTYLRKDGAPVVLAVKYKIIHDDKNQATILRNAFQDISDIRQLEAQLRQAQKLEAIGRLAGGIAHDFNNLLTIIRGYCSLLLKKTEDAPPINRTLTRIDEAGERAEKLTRQLLAFSRRQQLQPQVININTQVRNIREMLVRLLGEKIEIHLDLDEALYNIKVDPDQFEHVLINMAANARDAMPEGGIITFCTKNIDIREGTNSATVPAGDYAALRISDTGHGIAPEDLEHIFEPFYSDKDKSKGTGLGLAMAYGFINQSKGYIKVSSTPGKGASFEIYFPRCEENIVVSEQELENDDNLEGSESILVVEDEDHVRGLIGTALKEQGYNVFLSTERKEELDSLLLQQKEFDMILSDVIMPTQNGPQVVKYVQQSIPTIKVLFMSGYSDDLISSQGVMGKEVNFIQKPFTPKRLLMKIRNVLDDQRSLIKG